jgi:NAD/NADP transhydrogenase beta subunit
MPILEVRKVQKVMVFKRSMNTGYAGAALVSIQARQQLRLACR